MMKLILVSLSLALVLIADARSSWAGTNNEVIAPLCVPDGETLVNGNVQTGSMSVYHAAGTAPIRLFCALRHTSNSWKKMWMHYKDPDGMGINYRVRALLYKIHTNTTSGRVLVTTCDSSTSNATGLSSLSCDFSDFVPEDSHVYWVEVIIERSSTSANPELAQIWIED